MQVVGTGFKLVLSQKQDRIQNILTDNNSVHALQGMIVHRNTSVITLKSYKSVANRYGLNLKVSKEKSISRICRYLP